MRTRPALALSISSLLFVFSVVPAAAAAEVETVALKGLAGNPTDWFPDDLVVRITSPEGYQDAPCCEDDNSGEWEGPTYQGPSGTGNASIIYSVTADADAISAEEAALDNLTHDFPAIDSGVIGIPHIRNGVEVQRLEAFWVVTRCTFDQECAEHESAVAFYVGGGVYAVAGFSLTSPNHISDVVDNRDGREFNEEMARAAIGLVELVGTLPIRGGSSSEIINGTSGVDRISAGGGADHLIGGLGNDILKAQGGGDLVLGGEGGDTVNGGGGDDRIAGEAGADVLKGGSGKDRIHGGLGFDKVNGGRGRDVCFLDDAREKQASTSCEVKKIGIALIDALEGNLVVASDPLLIDPGRDGLDLSGEATTNLISGTNEHIRWTTQSTDDAFVAIDADGARAAGYDIQNAGGVPISGLVLFRDGLRVIDPGGAASVISDGWQMAGLLDTNRDGIVSDSDVLFSHLRAFVDTDVDGAMGAGEIFLLSDVGIRELGAAPLGAPGYNDPYGNVRTDGQYTGLDDGTGIATAVNLGQA